MEWRVAATDPLPHIYTEGKRIIKMAVERGLLSLLCFCVWHLVVKKVLTATTMGLSSSEDLASKKTDIRLAYHRMRFHPTARPPPANDKKNPARGEVMTRPAWSLPRQISQLTKTRVRHKMTGSGDVGMRGCGDAAVGLPWRVNRRSMADRFLPGPSTDSHYRRHYRTSTCGARWAWHCSRRTSGCAAEEVGPRPWDWPANQIRPRHRAGPQRRQHAHKKSHNVIGRWS